MCQGNGGDITNQTNPELDKAWNNAMMQLFGAANRQPSLPDLMKTGKPITEAIAGSLGKAMTEGMGKLSVQVDPQFRQRLVNDVYVFSGCKTYNELKEATRLLHDSKGALKPFGDFYNDVKAIHDKYNRAWLQAEYQHAVGSSRMAAKWQQMDDDDFYLQYRTALDEQVRDDHAVLHGITLPPSDEFWNEYYPPNGWGCRCDATQVNKDDHKPSNSRQAQELGERSTTHIDKKGRNRSAMFRFNPGKEGALFPEHHPYYSSAPRRQIEGWLKQNVIPQEVKATTLQPDNPTT